MSTTRKIEGYIQEPAEGPRVFWEVPFSQYSNPQGTLVFGKAFTEEEHEAEFQRRAKAMLKDMLGQEDLIPGDESNYPYQAVASGDIKAIAAIHGIQLP